MELTNKEKMIQINRNSLFLSDWEEEIVANLNALVIEERTFTRKEQEQLDRIYKKLKRDDSSSH